MEMSDWYYSFSWDQKKQNSRGGKITEVSDWLMSRDLIGCQKPTEENYPMIRGQRGAEVGVPGGLASPPSESDEFRALRVPSVAARVTSLPR